MTLLNPKTRPPKGRKTTLTCADCRRPFQDPCRGRGPKRKLCDSCINKHETTYRKKHQRILYQRRKLQRSLGYANPKGALQN